MQKTDTGLYTARTSGNSENNIAAYRVSVIDEVATPVLTVNSNWSSPDSCSFTCKGSNIIISSIYKSSSCSPEEVTSSDNYTLNLNCSDDYIMCIHSNPVSSKTARKKVNELCTVDQETPQAIKHSPYPTWFILLICLLIICLLASVIGWCLYKRKKGVKQSDDTDYDDVETLTQKMTGDTWTTVTYYAVDAPVLTVNSHWSSSDSYTVNFTCRAHDLMINSSYQNNRCSPQEVTSQINTLILDCSEESIICNHSNPVSWKIDRINITQLCGGVKQSDDTDYDDVETLTQKMTGDTWTTITYRTVGHQTPSSAHEC
ncbi:unnamed protein product [Leuciscus chuanchicus]